MPFPVGRDVSAKLMLNPGGGGRGARSPRKRRSGQRRHAPEMPASGPAPSSWHQWQQQSLVVRNAQKAAAGSSLDSIPALRLTGSDTGWLFISPNVPDFCIALISHLGRLRHRGQSRQPCPFLSCRLEHSSSTLCLANSCS